MNCFLNEIQKIRQEKKLIVDRSNKNRYRLVTHEKEGVKTAYYFSVPIYNETSRKLLDLKFQNRGSNATLLGSNCNITIEDSVFLENRQGSCQIMMKKGYRLKNDRCITYQGAEVFPTTNGIAMRVDLDAEKQYSFHLKTGLLLLPPDRPRACAEATCAIRLLNRPSLLRFSEL